MDFIGRDGKLVLFAEGNTGLVFDEIHNKIVSRSRLSTLIASGDWEHTSYRPDPLTVEILTAAITNLDIKVFSSGDRLYTIPKSVQAEAKRALEWRKEHKRGGTPVGINTARTLAKGGQIGIAKVRHIAKYFPRHEVDKKGKGYKPGQDNYPSNGRIAWALWGGDSSSSWALTIVERENNKNKSTSIVASSLYESVNYSKPERYDLDSFIHAGKLLEEDAPRFMIRIRLDGKGIDRLYKVDTDGLVSVWDDGSWDDFGNIEHDILTYDKTLDDPYDTCKKYHVPVDIESAVEISALFDARPLENVLIRSINQSESGMIVDAFGDMDFELLDKTMLAAGEADDTSTKNDGNYTPDERSENASKQVRDKTGRFAKDGSRVVIAGDPSLSGVIQSMDPASETITVTLDNGKTVTVPGNLIENQSTFSPINVTGFADSGLDTSGILGEPRTPIDEPLAYLPGRLPPLTGQSVGTLLNDWPSWVMDQRLAAEQNVDPVVIPDVGSRYSYNPAKVPNAYNDPYLRRWLDEEYSGGGTTTYPNRTWYNPIGVSNVEGAKTAEEVGYKAVPTGGGKYSSSWNRSSVTRDRDGNITSRSSSRGGTTASIMAAAEGLLTPETSDVPPIYMAIVAADDPQAVMDLVALIPAGKKTTESATFNRKNGKWVKDNQIMRDLNSPTPPPIIVLDNETFADVISQVDASSGATTASGWFSLDELVVASWGSDTHSVALIAAGGVDRNKGGAENLRRYWTVGKGGAKIRWGTGGDWTRCVRQLSKYLGPRAKGYCALRHKEMNGVWPGDKSNTGRSSVKASAFGLVEEEVLWDTYSLRAQANEARNRVVTAGGGEIPTVSGSKFVIPLVIPEGVESGDKRIFKKGSIEIRELPLPLLWQIKTADGHSGSVVVGKIIEMVRTDQGIGNAKGVFDSGEYGREAERLIRGGFIRGVSADMDQFEADEEPETSEEAGDGEDKKIGAGKIKITKARVMAVTIVPKPAFQECRLILADQISDKQEDEVIPDGVYVENVDSLEASALVACGIVAGVVPVTPPSAWFENQKLRQPTGLTVTDEGQVFGHIAAWHVDHIGMSFGTRPPRSRSKYSYFHTGLIRTEEGKDFPVGQLTLSGGHASLEASASEAVRHYDDTASAIADVHAGEDAHGIWVAGAIRPGSSPEQIRALRASSPSGDWRPIKGHLELVAVCQVNVPGFPIARARVASGQVMALVAAGAQTLAKLRNDPLTELSTRIGKLEQLENAPLVAAADSAIARFRSMELSIRAEKLSNTIKHVKKDMESDSDYMNQMMDDDPENELAVVSRKKRMELAKDKKALPDGSYPIRNESDLRNAIQAYGRAKAAKRAEVRKHIVRRARGLNRTDLIPSNWKEASVEEFSGDVDFLDLRTRALTAKKALIAATSPEDLIKIEDLTPEEIKTLEEEAKAQKVGKPARPERDGKYTAKTQPRDSKGKFRNILARIKLDAGSSGLDRVLDKIQETENLDNVGNYGESAKSAMDLIGIIDRLDSGALNATSLESIRTSAGELGKVIANLPFDFTNQSEKLRYSDLPPALRDLIDDMILRVEAKIGQEDADVATQEIKSFMSGSELYSQSEISGQMSKLLRLLT
jgi:hypothetical protein